MYCPNCGQSQTSEDIRFCSQCGLSLWDLARWLEGANAPWHPIPKSVEPSPRRKGIRLGAKLMFLGVVLLLPICFGLALLVDEPGPLLLPLMVFFAGLVWALYCRLFVDDKPAISPAVPTQMYRPQNEYLPPAQMSAPAALRAREPNTAEIIQPPSVTEYTTNLLGNRKKN